MKYALTLLLFFASSTHVFATENLTDEDVHQQTIQLRKNFNVENVAGASWKASLFHSFLNTIELADQSLDYTVWKLAMVPVKLIELAHLVGKLDPSDREQAIMDQRWTAMRNYTIGWGIEIGVHVLDAYAEEWGLGWTPVNRACLKLLKVYIFLGS